MKLTASQIKHFDEIRRDRRCAEDTLCIALNFHANILNEIIKREHELWETLGEMYGFEASSGWTLKSVDGEVTIVPLEA